MGGGCVEGVAYLTRGQRGSWMQKSVKECVDEVEDGVDILSQMFMLGLD